MSEIHVWLEKRKTGAHKICPSCQKRNRAANKTCSSCETTLKGVKRSFDGKKLYYLLRWINPKTGKEHTKSLGSDKSYAQHMQSKRRQELLDGVQVGLTKITFEKFVAEHLFHIENSLSEESYKQYKRSLNQFKTICQPLNLTGIDFCLLEKFRTSLIQTEISPATVNKYLRTLQSALQRAVKRNYIRVNPFLGNRKALYLPEPEKDIVTITYEELKKLLAACPDDRWYGIITVAYHAGLRQKEIINLQWADIDYDSHIIHVRNKIDHKTKSRKTRIVPMSEEVVRALKKLEPNRFKSTYIFSSDELRGKKMRNNISRDFGLIVKRAGLIDGEGKNKITMHDLRRTFVSDILELGLDVKNAQVLCGHQSTETTLKAYAAIRVKRMAEAVEKRSREARGAG